MVHCTLRPGQVTRAVRHRTVEEVWFCVSGGGPGVAREVKPTLASRRSSTSSRAWRSASRSGSAFQFRASGARPLELVIATMPPWPGDDEAVPVDRPLGGNPMTAWPALQRHRRAAGERGRGDHRRRHRRRRDGVLCPPRRAARGAARKAAGAVHADHARLDRRVSPAVRQPRGDRASSAKASTCSSISPSSPNCRATTCASASRATCSAPRRPRARSISATSSTRCTAGASPTSSCSSGDEARYRFPYLSPEHHPGAVSPGRRLARSEAAHARLRARQRRDDLPRHAGDRLRHAGRPGRRRADAARHDRLRARGRRDRTVRRDQSRRWPGCSWTCGRRSATSWSFPTCRRCRRRRR